MRRLNSSWQNLSEQFHEGREKVRILRQEREEEERRRQEEYREVLEKIYARVAEQPTLFERQSKVSNKKGHNFHKMYSAIILLKCLLLEIFGLKFKV